MSTPALPVSIKLCPWCRVAIATDRYGPWYIRKARFCSNRCSTSSRHGRLESRFWPRVLKAEGCWSWRGPFDEKGYGRLGKRLAHRIAWTLEVGPIPLGLHVLHRCDNPKCCNPSHLFLGTNLDNINDMVAKGRVCHGESNHFARHSVETVLEIKRLILRGASTGEIACATGVPKPTISGIRYGRTWKRLEPTEESAVELGT